MSKGKEEIKINPEDYDYMDALPLEGWMWEFIRRCLGYRELYREFRRIERKKDYGSVNPTLRAIRRDFAIRPTIKSDRELNSRRFLKVRDPRYEALDLRIGIPNPKIKYNQFPELLKPIIEGVTPVIAYEPNICEKRGIITDKTFIPVTKRAYIPAEHCDEMINEILPPVDVRNTLYVGISKKANKKDVRRILESITEHMVKSRDVRLKDETWKDCLFVYDLKEKLERRRAQMSYTEFVKILPENCPSYKLVRDLNELKKQSKKLEKKDYKTPEKAFLRRYPSAKRIGEKTIESRPNLIFQVDSQEYFQEKHCERFYKKAQSLIQGEYKKYLYLK